MRERFLKMKIKKNMRKIFNLKIFLKKYAKWLLVQNIVTFIFLLLPFINVPHIIMLNDIYNNRYLHMLNDTAVYTNISKTKFEPLDILTANVIYIYAKICQNIQIIVTLYLSILFSSSFLDSFGNMFK